jgi:hypothetical protein
LAQFEATQPSTTGAIQSIAQPSTARFEESWSPPPPPARFEATSSTIGYPTPNHNHVQANKRHAVIDDCSNSNGKVSNTKTKKVKTNGQIDSKAKSAPTIEGIADTFRLQSQCSSIAPCDWEDESKYDRENIEIWNAWLTFITNSEIKTRPLVPGAELFLIPPCLPWYIRSQNFVFIVMHFLTMEESHGYKNQMNANGEYLNHTSNALQSDGSLRSICYEQIRQGCTDELFWRFGKGEAIPWAFDYGTKDNKYLVFAEDHYTEIMKHYTVFMKVVINSSSKTLLCSQEVHALVKKMFGGKHSLDAYFKCNPDKFFSNSGEERSFHSHYLPKSLMSVQNVFLSWGAMI